MLLQYKHASTMHILYTDSNDPIDGLLLVDIPPAPLPEPPKIERMTAVQALRLSVSSPRLSASVARAALALYPGIAHDCAQYGVDVFV